MISRKAFLEKKAPIEEVVKKLSTLKPFDQLQRFFERRRNVTAMKYISKLNPKYGIPEVLSRDLLRVFRKSCSITSEDLCYFVESVLKCTLTNKDPGKKKSSGPRITSASRTSTVKKLTD
jgi:hypothetical protein